ncbi:MAG: type II secretion system F family protein [Candidatus Hydrogenedentota bacterium]
MIQIIIGVILVICIIITVILVKKVKTKDDGKSKLDNILAPYIDKEYFQKMEKIEAEEAAMGLTRRAKPSPLANIAKVLERIVVFEGYRQKLALKISSAGMQWRASEYLTLMMGIGGFCFLLGLSIGHIMWKNAFIVGVPLGIIGFQFPNIVLGFKKSGRQAAFQGQLVDTLGLISNSLKAGYSFLQAVEMTSREAPSPTKEEFQRLVRENSLGMPIDEALEAMGKRLESNDFDLTVTVVLIQRQIGGNLAEILDSIAATIRERIKLMGTISALTAQGKMGGIVITALPTGLYGIMYFMNPEVMGMLFESTMGYILIFIGFFMQGLGGFVIKNMLNVEM